MLSLWPESDVYAERSPPSSLQADLLPMGWFIGAFCCPWSRLVCYEHLRIISLLFLWIQSYGEKDDQELKHFSLSLDRWCAVRPIYVGQLSSHFSEVLNVLNSKFGNSSLHFESKIYRSYNKVIKVFDDLVIGPVNLNTIISANTLMKQCIDSTMHVM